MLGAGVKCNELLKNYCIFFVFVCLWELPPTLAPAAYSHGSVAKQWPRNCEAPGSKPRRCAILGNFRKLIAELESAVRVQNREVTIVTVG